MEKAIKLSQLKKIVVKPWEVLAIRAVALKTKEDLVETGEWLGERLKCSVIIVRDFEDFRVISAKKIKK